VTLVDTAGARATLDVVEREGVRRGAEARRVADLVLLVLDASEPATAEDEELLAATADSPRLVVANKRDRTSAATSPDAASATAYAVSALTGEGISGLRKGIAQALAGETTRQESPALSNVRHIGLLTEARGCLADALESAENRVPEEFLLTDLQDARRCFEDILREVFARFCIGK
jgi:tRNA modification GTPase